jgi:uncharacterized membrane protein
MHLIHPVLVHFPIALLVLCVVFELAAWFTRKSDLSMVGWWMQVLGTVGVILATLSGVVAEASVGVALLRAADTFALHEQLAFVTCVVFAALLFFRLSSRRALPAGWPRLYLAALTGGVILLLLTGWFGGELVFSYGIGVSSPSP